MNLIDVTRSFQSDDDCLAYMESMRWPDGIRCPTCHSDHVSKIERKAKTVTRKKADGGIREHKQRTRIYQCLEKCTMNTKGEMVNAQFSATSGTLFNDSHLSLQKWFMAVAIIVDAKKGVSANQLKEHLGIGSYRTSWYMSHRIRKAMEESRPTKMIGVVEVDETYIGGKSKRRGIQKRREKDMVLGMRERGGRVRFFHVPDGKKDTIRDIVNKNIRTDVQQIVTDSAVVYDFALDKVWQSRHHQVNHSTHWVSPAGVHTNTVESAFSLLKRGLIGSFHRVSIEHLHRYLSEFEWRFNERKAEDRFSMTLARMMGVEPMTYAALTEQA
jgi:transposase-like protein